MSTSALPAKSTASSYYFLITVVIYLAGSIILKDVGFLIVSVPLLLWLGYLCSSFYNIRSLLVNKRLLVFSIVFTVFLIVTFVTWSPAYDIKDVISTYLYFLVIPTLVYNICRLYPSFIPSAETGLTFFFYLFSGSVVLHTVIYGVDWERSNFFGIGILHKNGVSAFYEILYIITLYSSRKNTSTAKKVFIILLGMFCFIGIGSKTTLALAALFTLGLFARPIFYLCSYVAVVGLGYLVFYPGKIEDSPFRTATYRYLIWNQAWTEITKNPTAFFVGNGPGTFVSTTKEYELYGLDNTHNYLLQTWHNYGIIGACIFIGLFVGIYKSIGFWRSPAALAFWIFCFHGMFDVGWTKGPSFFASFCLGLALFYSYQYRTEQVQTVPA